METAQPLHKPACLMMEQQKNSTTTRIPFPASNLGSASQTPHTSREARSSAPGQSRFAR